MKRLLFTLFLLLAVTAFARPASAADIKLSWDANTGTPWQQVRIYERTGGTVPFTYTQIGEVAEPIATFTVANVTPGFHTYQVTAWNGQVESDYSNAVSTTIIGAASVPTNLKIQ
jgi:hypothetical protein